MISARPNVTSLASGRSGTAGQSQPKPTSSAAGPDSAIVVNHLSHRFAGGLLAVNNVSLSVSQGEFVVMVGPSGCGKTTVLNAIAGLLPGHVGGVIVAGKPPKAGRQDVAYMFAQDALLPWRRIIDNVLFGLEIHSGSRRLPPAAHDEAHELLAMVGLKDFANAYPRQLSHGMRQRVALARTFLLPSPILLMDEPFGALDAHTKLILEQFLLQLWERKKRTVIFITHDLAEAVSLADRVLVCTARPASIKADVVIDLPRPRKIGDLQNDPAYHEYYQKIWRELGTEMAI